MLTIRLQRTGKKNQADFRIVLAEKEAPVTKKVTEILGSYNPRKKIFQVKEDRLKYWMEQKVAMSPTIHNLLVSQSLLSTPKVHAFSISKKKAGDKPAETAAAVEVKPEAAIPVAEPTSAEAPAVEAAPAEIQSAAEVNPAESQPAPEPAKTEEVSPQ